MGWAPLICVWATLYLTKPLPISQALRNLWVPLTIVAMIWMFTFPLWLARRRVGVLARPSTRVLLVEGLFAALLAPFTLACLAGVATLLTYLLGPGATASVSLEPIATSSRRSDWIGLAILAVAVAPFAEEVFFRGMLYNALRQRVRPVLAAPIQATIFALVHPFGLAERALVGVTGVILAVLYERRKKLAAPIILHSLLNSISIGLLFWTLAANANVPVLGVSLDQHEGGGVIKRLQPGGAAETAGLRVGDVIQAAGEFAVTNHRDLVLILRTKHVGDTIPVYYLRDGEASQVNAVLKARPK